MTTTIPGISEDDFQEAWKASYAANRAYTGSFVGEVTPDSITGMLIALVTLGWSPPNRT
jgi:hypothetical protein